MSDATRCDYNTVVAAVTLFGSTGLGFNDAIRTIVAIEIALLKIQRNREASSRINRDGASTLI